MPRPETLGHGQQDQARGVEAALGRRHLHRRRVSRHGGDQQHLAVATALCRAGDRCRDFLERKARVDPHVDLARHDLADDGRESGVALGRIDGAVPWLQPEPDDPDVAKDQPAQIDRRLLADIIPYETRVPPGPSVASSR